MALKTVLCQCGHREDRRLMSTSHIFVFIVTGQNKRSQSKWDKEKKTQHTFSLGTWYSAPVPISGQYLRCSSETVFVEPDSRDRNKNLLEKSGLTVVILVTS